MNGYLPDLLKSIFGEAYDRPIGVPKKTTITYESARAAARAKIDDELEVGALKIDFKDKEEPKYQNHGEYTVWIRIQEVE